MPLPPPQPPSSVTPLADSTPSRLKLMRRGGTDRKSEFLRALKDEPNGEEAACYAPGLSAEVSVLPPAGWPVTGGDEPHARGCPSCPLFQSDGGTPEPKEQSEDLCQENGIAHSFSDWDTEHLSSSLEAEHRSAASMPLLI